MGIDTTLTSYLFTRSTEKKQHSLLPTIHEGRPPGFVMRSVCGGTGKARRLVCHFAVRDKQTSFYCLYYLFFLSSLADGVLGLAHMYLPLGRNGKSQSSVVTTVRLERQNWRQKNTVVPQPRF